jgi:acyl-CoA-binding protein
MSNIVVDPVDESADVEVENTVEPKETLEAQETEITAEEAQETVSEIPDKFAGKSVEDIVKSYQNLEQELGRKSQEIGELRSLSDSFLKAEISRNDPQTSQATQNSNNNETEEDFFEDPNKAVNSLIEKHPKFQEFQKFQAQQKQQTSKAQLEQTHPDYVDIVQDAKFQDWVQASKFRTDLFQEADSYNYDAADELLTHWKERSMIDKTAEVKQEQAETRKKALKSSKTESRSSAESTAGKKTYRRADLIRLKATDPNRYADLADEIYNAYAEGRVK